MHYILQLSLNIYYLMMSVEKTGGFRSYQVTLLVIVLMAYRDHVQIATRWVNDSRRAFYVTEPPSALHHFQKLLSILDIGHLRHDILW